MFFANGTNRTEASAQGHSSSVGDASTYCIEAHLITADSSRFLLRPIVSKATQMGVPTLGLIRLRRHTKLPFSVQIGKYL